MHKQKSVYVDDETERLWAEFHARYPRASFSEVTNVALRLYLAQANDVGIDGNLMLLDKS